MKEYIKPIIEEEKIELEDVVAASFVDTLDLTSDCEGEDL